MIEIPRAALTADRVAGAAEFFSFGRNDLTQTALPEAEPGLSRDDDTKLQQEYEATKFSRSARPTLEVGICGQHGGEPITVQFCHKVGMDYASSRLTVC